MGGDTIKAMTLIKGMGAFVLYCWPLVLWGGISDSSRRTSFEAMLKVKTASAAEDVSSIMELNLEEYLLGVVPSEMPASWPMEALKAQVVVARSYAFRQKMNRRGKAFHLESTVLDQVYNQNTYQSLPDRLQKRVRLAVEETQGELLYQNNQVLKAYYHADCGGVTEESSQVWGPSQVKLKSVVDTDCPHRDGGEWEYKIPRQRLSYVLSQHFQSPMDRLLGMQVVARSASGRITELAPFFSSQEERVITGQKLREVLGFNRLKSTNFSIFWDAEYVAFRGRGHGHGVGMCQWGAKSLADKGYSYKQILKHYYPNARLSHHAHQYTHSKEDHGT